ncbi:protein mono-ADP-ribosyltransferase PARP14-like isoform X2 [Hyla sarda]|uniref:protein mono-ADP-ribosyltransferase PARP14-like isoform X2 n=1 Tax=Hyla sarda TaxID=327740 RepID=UPI0024C22AEC|nr:protein mono-ADP-ribosyltransferase PARP14-like isoform X2 [Hyla sarda]
MRIAVLCLQHNTASENIYWSTNHTMADGGRTVKFSENPESMDKALPFSVEETSGANDEVHGMTLPEDNLDTQQAILESLSLRACTSSPPLRIIVKYGNLEHQKADVLGFPLLASKPDLDVFNITKDLKSTAENTFSNLFSTVLKSKKALQPGSCVELPTAEANYSLNCKYVIFINCSSWSNACDSPEKVLRDGIRTFLNKSNSMKGVKSVAVSAIGTGVALNFPNELAATIMGKEIKSFIDRHPDRNIKEIHIVIKQLQKYENVYIAYREILLAMDLGPRIKLCNKDGGCFTTITPGEHTQKKAGRLTVSVVYGDIVTESTSAIVNLTNFTTWGEHSVAKMIFTSAGADIIKSAQEGHDSGKKLVMTRAGHLNCDWILHCNCNGKLSNISDLVSEILSKCEHVGLKSVAIPAIGTGECRLRCEDVARCMMKGILPAAEKTNLKCLSCVRLITYSPYIYHVFCAELQKYFI